MSAQTSASEKKLKKVEGEARRLARNNSLDGNDLLYFFCQKYPIPALERDVAEPEELTLAEARFADQMWLIGRAYAASPERYSYSDEEGKGKPKEDLLDEEGYESFFQDIARIMLRNECHQANKPIAYFRGRPVDIRAKIRALGSDESIWNSIGGKDKAENLEKKANSAAGELSTQKTFVPEARLLKLINARDKDDLANQFETDIESIKESAECVFHFAKALNSARKLRDIACILETLKALSKKKEMTKKEKESLKKLPRRAELVAGAEPAVSISFASKFLHFHHPGLFFIFDSIASSKTRQINPRLTKIFKDFESFRNKVKKQISETLRRWDNEHKSRGGNKSEEEERKYLKHALEELTFAYFFFDSLLKSKDEETCKRLVERLRSSNPGCQSDCRVPAHHTYITRLVDTLVMNCEANVEPSGD